MKQSIVRNVQRLVCRALKPVRRWQHKSTRAHQPKINGVVATPFYLLLYLGEPYAWLRGYFLSMCGSALLFLFVARRKFFDRG